MTRLWVGTDFNEGLREDRRGSDGWWVQRLVWFAQDHDILVLPVQPRDAYLDYVSRFTGVKRETLKFVVPPPGRSGAGLVTSDRLRNPDFLASLREAIGGRPIERIFALWPDAALAPLARALGAEAALEGIEFLHQGGGALLKQEFLSGGRGNEIASPVEGVRSRRVAQPEDGAPQGQVPPPRRTPVVGGLGLLLSGMEFGNPPTSAESCAFLLPQERQARRTSMLAPSRAPP